MTSCLSSDQIEQLTTLLGSLARLTARGTAVDDRQLQVLLTAADLEGDADALRELQRWARLLQNARDAPDEAMRRTIAEGLVLRGVAEAPALLAVATVADGAAGTGTPSSPPAGRLAASPASLDFGTLAAGESATLELEVEGGPGQVVVESDQATVEPMAFDAGRTPLLVEVRPYGGKLLWTTIKLVTPADTLEVPVVAQWQAAPTATAPRATPTEIAVPTRSGTITVAADGSGDFPTLAQAVAAAASGATIRLGPGAYSLGEGLRLTRPISSLGEGMDQTEVTAERGAYVLSYEGSGAFALRDMTLRWTGECGADVVRVSGGRAEIERCRVRGAVWGHDEQQNECGGRGLWLGGDAQGYVSRCECTENATGICYDQNAGGAARRTRSANNHESGILVLGSARPTLEGNECTSCFAGIWYRESAGGVARGNRCISDGERGIVVGGWAQPTLEGNECRCGTSGTGISYSGDACGTALRNQCIGNGTGICVCERARPILEGNGCSENHEGMEYNEDSGGTARGNRCRANRLGGIVLYGYAEPVLEANECRENGRGIVYWTKSGGGTARGNLCIANDFEGIEITHDTNPILERNECSHNSVGIHYSDDSGGTARGNRCVQNRLYGIHVQRGARPTLDGNECRDNECGDVRDERT